MLDSSGEVLECGTLKTMENRVSGPNLQVWVESGWLSMRTDSVLSVDNKVAGPSSVRTLSQPSG